MSEMFKLKTNDFVKGAFTAVLAGGIMALAGVVSQTGFDVFTADWTGIFNTAVNAAIAAFVGYIAKNFLTDQNGKLLGKI